MEFRKSPQDNLATKALPKPLLAAIEHIFASKIEGCGLVGGTGLAGYYAGHRRSDDLDLFTRDETAQKMAVAAVKSLQKMGANIQDERNSPDYYHALIELRGHAFTADVVLDKNIHVVGAFETTSNGVSVATLDTLQMMKVAALVSRCSAKDLFDVIWLKNNFRDCGVEELVNLGQQVDRGVNAESLLMSLCGSTLREDGCHFSLNTSTTPKEILNQISEYKLSLQVDLAHHLEKSNVAPPIALLIRKFKKWL